MKHNIKALIIGVLTSISTISLGQERPDEQSFEFSSNALETLHLHNLRGEVNVKGTNSSSIKVRVRRKLQGSNGQMASLRSTFYFDTLSRDNQIYFFMQSPNHDFKINEGGNGYYQSCNQNWDDNRKSVNYRFDITVEFPSGMNLNVSNHHDFLSIANVQGDLRARNHHKDLVATDIGGNARVRNHHGDIELSFTNNPSEDCSFKTHHGDIRIAYQDNLSADVQLKSHHGEFFTAFNWEPRPLQVTQESNRRGTKYKVGEGTGVTIGNGGPMQEFSTWHGDIYLEKRD